MASVTAPVGSVDSVGVPEDRSWWVYLVTGSLWLVFGFAILNGHDDMTTVWTVAIFAGALFLCFGFGEFVTAFVAEGWRWFHILMGIAGILAGIMAFAWPGQTFLTLAAIIGWYILFSGVMHVSLAVMARDLDDLWWMTLLVGIAEILLAFWALGYPGRSIRLLILWVAASALVRGTLQVVAAFSLRAARRHVAA
jgi:uncharacterized membrane protein HdeD (DUF308 family)